MPVIRVNHPRFVVKNLSVKTAGLFGPKLLLEGKTLQREKGAYTALDDAGTPVSVTLKSLIDPIPKVQIDGATIEIARPLRWYEYACAAWPVVLVFAGGAIGGGLGAGAAMANLMIIRNDWPAPLRYLACFVVGLIAVATYVVLAGMIHVAAS